MSPVDESSGAGRRTRGRRRDGVPDAKAQQKGPKAQQKGPTDEEVDVESLAREICLQALTRAPRSRAQLAQALERRQIPAAVAEAVLGRLSATGLLNDAEFAATWVDSRRQSRGLAREALARELRERGVASDLAGAAADRIGPDEELAAARRLVARRLAATSSLPAASRAQKLAAMLARRGYGTELALQVVREALENEGVDQAELGEAGIL